MLNNVKREILENDKNYYKILQNIFLKLFYHNSYFIRRILREYIWKKKS